MYYSSPKVLISSLSFLVKTRASSRLELPSESWCKSQRKALMCTIKNPSFGSNIFLFLRLRFHKAHLKFVIMIFSLVSKSSKYKVLQYIK